MAVHDWNYLLLLVLLPTARCQGPWIAEDIFPEIKKIGQSGYLNCTVGQQQSGSVYWIQALTTDEIIISINTSINVPNPEVNGTRKYEVIRRFGDNDRTTYTLVVNRLRENNSGRYKCMVSIPGIGSAQWPYKYGNITVQVPPTIIISGTPNIVEGLLGYDVSLMCNATGTPMPNITWVRPDGKTLPDGRLLHRGHLLILTNIRKKDRGIYRCLADNNILPRTHRDVILVVAFKPEAEAVQNAVGQAQNMGLHAVLNCRIEGYPRPLLRWYKQIAGDLQFLSDDEKYDVNQMITNGTSLQFIGDILYSLKILNVEANDYTVYICEATNSLGSSSAAVQLFETEQCQGQDCPDIDECNSRTDICDQLCFNTDGSYRCACQDGYRLEGNSLCIDNDECSSGVHNCHHNCINTPGSYDCSCENGYVTSDAGRNCTVDPNNKPCGTTVLNCAYGCRNGTNGAECFCQSGYAVSDTTRCVDVNECANGLCQQSCTNLDGGFTCNCFAGFKLLSDKITCEKCDSVHWGPNCANVCECSENAADCHNVRGCVCNSGWTGADCDTDVDECSTVQCGYLEKCENFPGTYNCVCMDGYQNVSGQCQGIKMSTPAVTFKRDKAIVRNITENAAVLLIDMRDPSGQSPSLSYNLRCEETPADQIAVNIDIEKKDPSWGNGTARFSLVGLSPGQTYRCQATSRTAFGPGWDDNFSFMTSPREVRRGPLDHIKWHHAAGLGAVGLLLFLGVLVAQNRNA